LVVTQVKHNIVMINSGMDKVVDTFNLWVFMVTMEGMVKLEDIMMDIITVIAAMVMGMVIK